MKVTRMREDVTIDAINLILGGVLFFSPWIFGFAGERLASFNAWAGGIVIAGLALAALYAFERWEEWLTAAAGVWVAASPWVLGFAAVSAAMWVHVAIGFGVAILAGLELWRQHDNSHVAS